MEQFHEIRRFTEKQEDPTLRPEGLAASLPAEFQEILTHVEEISGKWNAVEIYTPDTDSIAREKEAFLASLDAGRDYLPSFAYGTAEGFLIGDNRRKLEDLLGRVRVMEPASRIERLARAALRAKLMDDLATCDLVEGIRGKDDALVRRAMNQKYRPVDELLLREEIREFETMLAFKGDGADVPPPERFTPEETKALQSMMLDTAQQEALFRWALDEYGILHDEENAGGFRVEVTDDVQFLDVRHRSAKGPTIFLKNAPMSAYDALRLLRHEIEGHARQVANGQALFRLGGGALTLDDETLYEGLAMRLENEAVARYFGPEPQAIRFYAHAVRTAEEGGSFREVFDEQERLTLRTLLKVPLSEELPSAIDPAVREKARAGAWRTTYRIMRGHTDTSNKEGFAMRKDIGYARGALMDAELVRMGKGHFNEVAVIAKGGLELLGEFDLTPEQVPYKDRNLTAVFAEALREALVHGRIFDIRALVRARGRRILENGSEFDVMG